MKLLCLSQWVKCAIPLCYLTIPHSPYCLPASTSVVPPHSPFVPTDYVGIAGNTVGLHSGGTKFRSWEGYCLYWLRIFVVFLILFLNEYNVLLSNNRPHCSFSTPFLSHPLQLRQHRYITQESFKQVFLLNSFSPYIFVFPSYFAVLFKRLSPKISLPAHNFLLFLCPDLYGLSYCWEIPVTQW
jgi:hypothetical protein